MNEGNDTVEASVSWQLGDNVENLRLTGSNRIDGTGNALDNHIIGNWRSNCCPAVVATTTWKAAAATTR